MNRFVSTTQDFYEQPVAPSDFWLPLPLPVGIHPQLIHEHILVSELDISADF